MSDQNLAETSPLSVEEDLPPTKGRLPIWIVIIVGVLMLLTIAGISAYGGYQSGIEQRLNAQGTQAVHAVQTQYALALADIDAGNYGLADQRRDWFRNISPSSRPLTDEIAIELAVQLELAQREIAAKNYTQAETRLNWILEWQPDYPGAQDALAELLFQSRITVTPTPMPTPTLVPTADIRSQEKLYTDSQQALAAGNWSVAIENILTLRKLDSTYETVQLDGMLYVAYRNRGVDKIIGKIDTDATIEGPDLQGGSYDLTLAEQFGALDQEAEAWRRRAKWYLSGASYWGVDWAKAISYFELLFLEAPFLSDGTQYAKDRYLGGLVKYGDWLAAKGEWCLAQEQYQKALDNGYADPIFESTPIYAGEQCGSGAPPPEGQTTPTPEGEVTPTPTVSP
jgi:outer membrane protein assembly factor BamD (BamD/ComL family)